MEVLEQLGRLLDRLITLDLCYKFGEKDNLRNLYDATKTALGISKKDSVTYYTAEKMSSILKPSCHVIITTGFRIPPAMLYGETDGPVGAAALARTLYLGYNCNVFFLLEQELHAMMGEVANVVEIPISSNNLISFTKSPEFAHSEAERVLHEVKPVCIISIERPGANRKGEYHTSRGINISEHTARVDSLFEKAKHENILTIGIGDVGNELGMGKIKEAIVKNVKTGNKCQCPCQAGIAPSVEVDIPIIASVSNWGAHALAAMLAAKIKNPDVFHDGDMEVSLIEACVRQKAVDGSTKKADISVDALPAEIHSSVVEIMKTAIHGALQVSGGGLIGR